MNYFKTICLILVSLLLLSGETFSQKEVFYDGEELFYDVYYSFINIGWVKVNTKKDKDRNNVWVCTAVMRSNEAMPFVSASYDFTSEIEIIDDEIRPLHFYAKEFNGASNSVMNYYFDYDSSFVDIEKTGFDGQQEYDKRIPLNAIYQDGLSIFYYARLSGLKNDTKLVPVLFNQDLTTLTLNFDSKKTDASIGEVDYDVSSNYLTGNTTYELVFGLTGDFSGWFTKDEASVPIKAKLKVKIGNITLELKDWKRGNWKPPEF